MAAGIGPDHPGRLPLYQAATRDPSPAKRGAAAAWAGLQQQRPASGFAFQGRRRLCWPVPVITGLPRRLQRRLRKMLLLLLGLLLAASVLALVVYLPPARLIARMQGWWPDVVFRADESTLPGRRVVAWTFDDSPSAYTPELLDIAEAYGHRLTLFCIGAQIMRHATDAASRAVLVRALRNGHELANHAMHDEPSWLMPHGQLAREVLMVDSLLDELYAEANVTRPSPRIFRPGSGFFTSGMITVLHNLGHRLVLGDVYPHDPFISWPHVNARHVLWSTRPGSIIINHDRRSWAPEQARVVAAGLQARQLVSRPVSEMIRGDPT